MLVHQDDAMSMSWDAGHYAVEIPSTHEATQRVHLEIYGEDWMKPWAEQRVRVTHVEVVQRDFTHYIADLSDHERAKTAPPRALPAVGETAVTVGAALARTPKVFATAAIVLLVGDADNSMGSDPVKSSSRPMNRLNSFLSPSR